MDQDAKWQGLPPKPEMPEAVGEWVRQHGNRIGHLVYFPVRNRSTTRSIHADQRSPNRPK